MRKARQTQLAREKEARRKAHPERARYRPNEKPPTCGAPRRMFLDAGLSIRTKLTDNNLTYIDEQGRVWKEDVRSAQQLIADYQKKGGPHDVQRRKAR